MKDEKDKRIAELEYKYEQESSFSRAIIDARDAHIAELEVAEKRWCQQAIDYENRIAELKGLLTELCQRIAKL